MYDFGALFLWDVRLRKNCGDIGLMSLELGIMPRLKEDYIIVDLMLHGGIGACVDARVEDLRFELSNPRMEM